MPKLVPVEIAYLVLSFIGIYGARRFIRFGRYLDSYVERRRAKRKIENSTNIKE